MRVDYRPLAALLPLAVLLAGGCGQSTPTKATPAAARFDETPPPKIAPEQCAEFGERFVATLAGNDPIAVCKLFDCRRLVQRAARGTDTPQKVYDEFLVGIERTFAQGKFGLATDLVEAVTSGSGVTIIGPKSDQGYPGIMLRVLTDGGVNYIHLILGRDAFDDVCGVDAYVFVSAEYLSDSLRRFLLAAADEETRGIVDRISGRHNPLVEGLPKLTEMRNQLRQGNYEEVLAIYNALPEEFQHERLVLVDRLTAAQEVSDREYARALADFDRRVGPDARIDLVLIDGYFLKEQYDKVLESIDAVQRDVGDDPYLEVMRASVYLAQNDYAAARQAARAAIDREPEMIDGYWTLLTASLRTKQFDEAVQVMGLIVERFNLEFGDLSELPEYAEFVQSPQYARWQIDHPIAPPEQPLLLDDDE